MDTNFESAQLRAGIATALGRRVIDLRTVCETKLGVSHQTGRHYMCQPHLRHRMPPGAFKAPGGRAWLWWEDEVDAWLATGQRAPEALAARRGPGRPKGRRNKMRRGLPISEPTASASGALP